LIRKTLAVGIIVILIFSVNIPSKNIDNDEKTISVTSEDFNNLLTQVKTNKESSRGWANEQKLLASDGAAGDIFGFSVSIRDDYAIIGAIFDNNENGIYAGAAYVFKRSGSTWNQQAKLIASDGTQGDQFGWSVSICDNYAIISAYNDDDNGLSSGSAYIFSRSGTTWTQQEKLLASDGTADDYFGHSVSIDDNYVIIGAPYNHNGDYYGSAYIFTRSGTIWTEQTKLLASDGAAGEQFGYSVSIDGDYAIIGASNGAKSNTAYVFKRNLTNWNEQAKLIASNVTVNTAMGSPVCINGNYAILGTFSSAHVFKRNETTWIEEAKLIPSDGTEVPFFGESVSINGDYAIIGASMDSDNGIGSGSAYIFSHSGTTWVQELKILAPDGVAFDQFGWSVSISGDYAIVGASYDDDNGWDSGSAYIYIDVSSGPHLFCMGDISWQYVRPGHLKTDIFTVENVGDSQSLLNWEISEYPEWGNWSFNPESGIDLEKGDTVKIRVWVEAPNEEGQTFTGEIKIINSDNPSDYCYIDVFLATPVNQPMQQSLLQRFLDRFPNMFPILRNLLEAQY